MKIENALFKKVESACRILDMVVIVSHFYVNFDMAVFIINRLNLTQGGIVGIKTSVFLSQLVFLYKEPLGLVKFKKCYEN